ncbi:MAG TPA: PBP1A family penicillin-binding protein [Longimicrobiaceae bacterium]|nr:PBP1A family penicillin-binding protein [Longimicrobiaceae bacterium]
MRRPRILDRDAWRGWLQGWRAELREARGNRRQALLLAALVLLGVGACGAGAAVGAWTQVCATGCPTAREIEDFAPRQASILYDDRGGVLGMFYRERRQLVPIGTLPRYVPLAFVSIEDRRFFEHEGVDLVRMVAAVRDNLIGGWGGPGGSTITMQLARNLFPEQLPMREKTLRRKLAEMRLARQIEAHFSKRQILQLYLNHIYLGSGAYGVEAAARTYFGKSASELTIPEAATLAALPKAPSRYDPRRDPEAALQRRNLVLRAMAEYGVIDEAQARRFERTRLVLAPPRGVEHAPYFVEQVRRQLEDRFGELLYTGGLKIYTTIDPELQRASEIALEGQLEAVEKGEYGDFRAPTYAGFTAAHAGHDNFAQTPYLQGLVVVMDPISGAVRAMVGGRDFRQSQFNRATQALRQPGSAFKPFVYAAALEQGRSPLSEIEDAPLSIGQADGSVWTPENYEAGYEGEMSLRAALMHSRNLPAIRLGLEVGVDAVRGVARRAGVGTPIPGYPSVFIGSAAVYPIDLISAYAAFANGGLRVEPRYVQRVDDREGHLLWQPADPPRTAFAPSLSWILTDMLREVVDHGTGYSVRDPAVGDLPYTIPAAGKTGTTNDNADAWFVGYTPDLLAGVWIGFDQPKRIQPGATGGGLAAPVWARVVRTYYRTHPIPTPWARPADVAIRHISRWTGKAVTEDCPYMVGAYTDYFVGSAAPEAGCDPPEVQFQRDPTPWLPGRPVFPGRPRVPERELLDTVPKRGGGEAP